ncbi:MAG: hypothetical protein ACPG80_01065, partial [Rickettsiales bacterium]
MISKPKINRLANTAKQQAAGAKNKVLPPRYDRNLASSRQFIDRRLAQLSNGGKLKLSYPSLGAAFPRLDNDDIAYLADKLADGPAITQLDLYEHAYDDGA